MNVCIGIIGPEDSVQQILTVTPEFPNVEFIPLIYKDVYQVDELICNQTKQIDQWLFSGVLNYNYAIQKKLVHPNSATYPPLYGSSFFGTLLEAQLAENKVFQKISIDTFSDEEIQKVLSFYNLKKIQFTNYPFNHYTYIHELADFHERLYRQGKSEVAITSTNFAYEELKKRNIPVYRMNPSYLSIKLSLNLLVERAHANRFKKSQIAIIGCLVDFHYKERDIIHSTYKMKQEELDIKKELLSLAEKVNGSFVSIGNGYYVIYTNRGEINREIEQYIFQLHRKIDEAYHLQLRFSIGFGENANQAEQHVHLGLKQNSDESSVIVVDESKNILILEEKDFDNPVQYSTKSIGEEWEKKIKKCGISVSIITKVTAMAKHYHRREFSSKDLTRWLSTSDRNARRILLQLKKGGIIKQCGEIQSGVRGRPMRLYCFTDKESESGG